MSWIGDIQLGQTFDVKFCTVQSTGAPTTLSGTPAIACYVGNSTTEITAGITLTADFDGRTGLNNVRVVATSGNGYTTASDCQLVITTGTVNSVSAVGYVVAQFSIENRVLNLGRINLPVGGIPALGIIDNGTLQSATGTTAVIRSAASFADSRLIGMTIQITSGTGVGQARIITAYNNTSKTVTVDTWTTNPDNTSTYVVFGTPPASTSAPIPTNLTQVNGHAVTDTTSGVLDVNAARHGGTVQTGADLAGLLGALNAAASSGDPGTTTTIVQYLKQIINTLEGSAGIPSFPAAADAANAVSLAEVIRQINARLVGTIAGGTHVAQSGDVYPLVDTEIAAIKAKTDNLPASPAAVGSAMTLTAAYDAAKTAAQAGDQMNLAAGAIDDTKFAAPAAPAALPVLGTSKPLALLAWLVGRDGLMKRTFNKSTGVETQRNAADNATLGTATHTDDGTTVTRSKLS